ncbi:uncharacterized protein LOC144018176 [Festucalex cinctus]
MQQTQHHNMFAGCLLLFVFLSGAGLEWRCDGNTLVGRATAMMPTADRWRLTPGKRQEVGRGEEEEEDLHEHISRLRQRRASPHDERTTTEKKATMTDEQKEYLRWFYRTEDPTVWKFVMLGLSFVCLLVGFLLLGMGAMASRNRRKIAKYKAAAAAARSGAGDQMWAGGDDGAFACATPSSRRALPAPCNGDTGDVKAGSIVVTWKDGNTSCLYADAPAHDDQDQDQVEVEPPLPDDQDEARVQREDEDEMKDEGDR